jgi:hypothetical protein
MILRGERIGRYRRARADVLHFAGRTSLVSSEGAGLAVGVTRFTAGAVGICAALAGIEIAHAFGAAVPHALALVSASACAVIAATVAARNVAFVRRGPVILAFPRGEAMLCDAREASVVRSAAQLRGTMGGAGYLHPRRLAFAATAWSAISAQALALVTQQRSAVTFVPLAIALVAGGLAAVFPARPFFYREAGGGCVLAFPPHVCRRLLDAAGATPALRPVALGISVAGQAVGEAGPSKAEAGAETSERDGARSDRSTPT